MTLACSFLRCIVGEGFEVPWICMSLLVKVRILCLLYIMGAHKKKKKKPTHSHTQSGPRAPNILFSRASYIIKKRKKEKKSPCDVNQSVCQFELRSWSDGGKLVSSSCRRNLRRQLALHKQAKLCFTVMALKSKPHRSEWASEES